jgi:hypothetical protein
MKLNTEFRMFYSFNYAYKTLYQAADTAESIERNSIIATIEQLSQPVEYCPT